MYKQDTTSSINPSESTINSDPIFRKVWKTQKQQPTYNQHVDYLKGNTKELPNEVIDFENLRETDPVEPVVIQSEQHADPSSVWNTEKAFTVKGKPGFIFICNSFPQEYEAEWIIRCCFNYATNHEITQSNLHRVYSKEQIHKLFHPVTSEEDIEKKRIMFKKLKWSTLGYHFNWDIRAYEQHVKSPMPDELAKMSKRLAGFVGQEIVPETAIVNYYGRGANMGAHKDDSEIATKIPVVSLTLGCPGIFVLGGDTLEDPPVAMYVRGGDTVIIGGESRHAIHGVPCAFPGLWKPGMEDCVRKTFINMKDEIRTIPAYRDCNDELLERIFETFLEYVKEVRVNVNVRQVFPNGYVNTEESGVIGNPNWKDEYLAMGMGKV